MICAVRIRGYKSLWDASFTLYPVTAILGPNAVGKSNLFDALHLLSRIVSTPSLVDAFAEHRGDPLEAFTFDEGGLNHLLKKESVSFSIEVDVELSPSTISEIEKNLQMYSAKNKLKSKSQHITYRFLRYSITIGMTPRTGTLYVADERLEPLVKTGDQLRPVTQRRPFIERVGDRIRLHMEERKEYTEFELGMGCSVMSQALYPPYYPHLTAFREEASRWQFYHLDPNKMRSISPVKAATHISASGEDLAAFYYTLKNTNPNQFDNLVRVLQMLVPDISGLDAELTQAGKLRLKVREEDVEFSAKVVSEGTLRLLGLLAILSPTNSATTISFEEPENGVHPKRLKLLADLFYNASQRSQIIINTHSYLLAEHLASFACIVHCHKQDTRTSFEPLQLPELIQQRVRNRFENNALY